MNEPLDLDLQEGETVVRNEMASVTTGMVSQYSRLVLTNRRLVAIPADAVPFAATSLGRYEIELVNVTRVEKGSFRSRFKPDSRFFRRPEVVVYLRDGSPFSFRASSARAWLTDLAEVAR